MSKIFRDEKIWRWLTNFWTLISLVIVCADFFTYGRFDFLIAPMSVIYVGILGLYVTTKEFDRWYELHKNDRHPGEWFVLIWTLIIFGLLTISVFDRARRVPTEAIATYIMVLSVFALTQKSKALHRRKSKKPRGKSLTLISKVK